MDEAKEAYQDGSNDKAYFTMLPNLVLRELDDVYSRSLYWTIKRIAGEQGECFCSTKKLAELSAMSVGKVVETRKKLIQKRLIEFVGKRKTAGKPVNRYQITDIWMKNMEHFNLSSAEDQSQLSSPHERISSPHERISSPHEPKKTYRRRSLEEEVSQQTGLTSEKPGQPPPEVTDYLKNGSHPTSQKKKEPSASKEGTKSKRKSVTFPSEWYRSVEEAYKRIKGIDPQGDEWKPIQQEIKTMFLSERKPEQIIELMEALESSSEVWTENWTLKTVRLKMPFWVTGALDLGFDAVTGKEYQRLWEPEDDMKIPDDPGHYITLTAEEMGLESENLEAVGID